MQPLDETLGGRLGILGVDPLLLAGALLFAQPRGARIPIVDLAGEPRPDFALDLVDLGEPALLHLGEMLGHKGRDRVAERALLDLAGKPGRGNTHPRPALAPRP